MVWNRQELTKEDLVKAGLNPDDLADLKAKGVTKEELTALETKMTTSITEALTNGLRDLETRLRTPIKRENEEQQRQQQEEVDPNTEFLTDPTAYINKQTNKAVAFTAVSNTKLRMDLAMDRAKMSLKGFKNDILRKEIEEEWNQYKPENMAITKDFDPDKLILKIHNMVIGNHHEEIQHDTDKREGKFNMVASGTSNGGGGNTSVGDTSKKPEDQLTPAELKQAARYGMTAKEWIEQNNEMESEQEKVLTGDN